MGQKITFKFKALKLLYFYEKIYNYTCFCISVVSVLG